MKYEIWKKDNLGSRKGQPEDTSYTLDTAMLKAKDLSNKTVKTNLYNPNKKVPNQGFDGGYEDVFLPLAFAVVERGDKQSRVRGWGIGGKWYDAKDCKRCNNTGQDPNVWGDICSSCKGSSFVPKV